MYKGEEFEVQQLHIVDKLERAHQELAKQWQELDVERQKSIEEQEQQRQRIQVFAKEQAELQAGLEIQLESEVQKRYEWETHQQQFLEQQQQRLEDQWQREQDKRKQQWEKEQEEEFSKLQQRFQHLQQQFQERLDSAAQPRAIESGTLRAPLDANLQKSSELPLDGTRQSTSSEQSRHRTAEDAASTPNPSHVSREGCLQGCLQGFQKSKESKDPKKDRRSQELQEPLAWAVDVPRAKCTNREASSGTAGNVACRTGGMADSGTGLAEPTTARTVATNVAEFEFNKSPRPREEETKKLKHSVVGHSEWVALPNTEPSTEPIVPTPDTLREPLALAGSYRGRPAAKAAKAANPRNFSETDQLGICGQKFTEGHLDDPRYGTNSTSGTAQQLTELGKAQSKHQDHMLYSRCISIVLNDAKPVRSSADKQVGDISKYITIVAVCWDGVLLYVAMACFFKKGFHGISTSCRNSLGVMEPFRGPLTQRREVSRNSLKRILQLRCFFPPWYLFIPMCFS